MPARIKKNDTVKVISGKDAGKEGRVVQVYPKAGRVMIEGINRVTKHKRVQQTRRGAKSGGITHEESPIDMSNVMPICPSCGQPTRTGTKFIDGKAHRACRRCDGEF